MKLDVNEITVRYEWNTEAYRSADNNEVCVTMG